MKRMKKIFALALTVIMVLGLATTAFAADTENTVEISVVTSDSGTSVAGHTYKVYQIFTGTVATDGKTLSDIVIGKNVEDKTVNDVMALLKGKSDAEAAAENDWSTAYSAAKPSRLPVQKMQNTAMPK